MATNSSRRGLVDRRVVGVVGGVVLIGTSAAAIATGCYVERGSLCSSFHNDIWPECPDEILVDSDIHTIEWAAFEAPGLTGFTAETCWYQVQVINFTGGECTPGPVLTLGPITYFDPTGDECYPS